MWGGLLFSIFSYLIPMLMYKILAFNYLFLFFVLKPVMMLACTTKFYTVM